MANNRKEKFRVEIFYDNGWCQWSAHLNNENAFINAETIRNSRKIDTRVIYKGNIVMFYEKSGGSVGDLRT
jgi:hypothetical protein